MYGARRYVLSSVVRISFAMAWRRASRDLSGDADATSAAYRSWPSPRARRAASTRWPARAPAACFPCVRRRRRGAEANGADWPAATALKGRRRAAEAPARTRGGRCRAGDGVRGPPHEGGDRGTQMTSPPMKARSNRYVSVHTPPVCYNESSVEPQQRERRPRRNDRSSMIVVCSYLSHASGPQAQSGASTRTAQRRSATPFRSRRTQA